MSGTAGVCPDGFVLGGVLGRGGSGTVFGARQVSTGRTVALKVLPIDTDEGETVRRFERERAAMSELAGHPHIVSILDAGLQHGHAWLAMDLCPLGSLARVDRPMPVDEVLVTMHAVATALHDADIRGILHCDVKPANILLTGYGRPALSDFGIARLSLGGRPSTTAGGYTLDHVAPEVLEGRRPTDRSDIFSLGTTAWQLLAGRPPFRRPGDVGVASVMRRIQAEPLPALSRGDVPPGVVELLQAMTAKDPGVRPSAEQVARQVEGMARAIGTGLGGALPATADLLHSFPPLAGGTPGPTGAVAAATGDRGVAPAGWAIRGPGGGTDHRPDLGQLTRDGRPAAVATPLPPLPVGPTTKRRDPVVVVALVAAMAVVLALGGLTTWRLWPSDAAALSALAAPASAAGAPAAVTDGPVPAAGASPLDAAGILGSSAGILGGSAGTAPLSGAAPTAPGAKPATPGSTPPVPGTTAGSGTGGAASPGPVVPKATLSSVTLGSPTCHRITDGTCRQGASLVAFTVRVDNSDGAMPVTGCTADVTVGNPDGTTSSLGTVRCNSRVSFNPAGPGRYNVAITASYNDSQLSDAYVVVIGGG